MGVALPRPLSSTQRASPLRLPLQGGAPASSKDGMSMSTAAPIEKHGIKIGTDCYGIEAPILGVEELAIDFDHVFSSETD